MNVALIPAKGVSTRIPGKNIRMFHGKPIIAYSIKAAIDSGLFSSVIVSTDDVQVERIAHEYGADVLRRGADWTRESVGPLDVARHSLDLISDVSLMCVIYATAPLMTTTDLIRGYREVNREGVAYSVSIGTQPFLHDAAQFFWCQPWALRERVPEFAEHTTMVPIEAGRVCDINVEADWVRAELLYAAMAKRLTC